MNRGKVGKLMAKIKEKGSNTVNQTRKKWFGRGGDRGVAKALM